MTERIVMTVLELFAMLAAVSLFWNKPDKQ
jgi:hypothetical protein